MQINIDDSAKSLGVDKAYVLMCHGLSTGTASCAALEPIIDAVEQEIKAEGQGQSVFEVSFRTMFERMGYPGLVPAGVKLRNRVAHTGFKRISSTIDAYNLIAARYSYGIGAHDVSYLSQCEHSELIIKRATGSETILPLFAEKKYTIPRGDLLYTLDGKTVAWLGKRDIDSDEFKITQNSHAVFFVLIGREDISNVMLKMVNDEIVANLSLCHPFLKTRIYESIPLI
jgi:DNA/RNA-binding domain of Phe-tRNA-synthetase-like protein